MNSIRVRVLIAATLVTGVMLVLAGITLLTLLREGLIRQLDERLLTAALGLTQAFENTHGKLHFEWEGIETGLPLVFRAEDQSSQVIAESRGRIKVANDLPPSSKFSLNQPDVFPTRLSDGALARVVTLHFKPHLEVDEDEDEDKDDEAAGDVDTAEGAWRFSGRHQRYDHITCSRFSRRGL